MLSCSGRVDHTSAEMFKDALESPLERCGAGRDHIVLDFSALDYIDLIAAGTSRRTKRREGPRARDNPSPGPP